MNSIKMFVLVALCIDSLHAVDAASLPSLDEAEVPGDSAYSRVLSVKIVKPVQSDRVRLIEVKYLVPQVRRFACVSEDVSRLIVTESTRGYLLGEVSGCPVATLEELRDIAKPEVHKFLLNNCSLWEKNEKHFFLNAEETGIKLLLGLEQLSQQLQSSRANETHLRGQLAAARLVNEKLQEKIKSHEARDGDLFARFNDRFAERQSLSELQRQIIRQRESAWSNYAIVAGVSVAVGLVLKPLYDWMNQE